MPTVTYVPKVDVTTAEKIEIVQQTLDELDQKISNLELQVQALDRAGVCTGVVHSSMAGIVILALSNKIRALIGLSSAAANLARVPDQCTLIGHVGSEISVRR